jgi:fatty-acyl-CoA synthase
VQEQVRWGAVDQGVAGGGRSGDQFGGPFDKRRAARQTKTGRPRTQTPTGNAMTDLYRKGLDRRPANFQPLTPLGFLARSAGVFPERVAIIHGPQRVTYAEFYARARQLASAVRAAGVRPGQTVAALLLNTPPMLEAHYGVPMAGAVLNALNTRLDAAGIGFILDHGEAKLVIVDSELAPLLREAMELMQGAPPLVVEYTDATAEAARVGLGPDYQDFLAGGDPEFAWEMPGDEWDAISLNYTSGTTGNPKGVVYHHRGAALLATGNVVHARLAEPMVYLWTLPMFHCNGWCFPWSVSVASGTHVCLRQVRAGPIYQAIAEHKVNLLCGAPIVMSVLLNAPEAESRAFDHKVTFLTAAAPPPEAVLAAMADAGFEVIHGDQRVEAGMGRAGWAGARCQEGAPGSAVCGSGGARRDRSGDHATGARRRRNHRRDHVSGQCGDEGLSEERRGHRGGLCRGLVPLR